MKTKIRCTKLRCDAIILEADCPYEDDNGMYYYSVRELLKQIVDNEEDGLILSGIFNLWNGKYTAETYIYTWDDMVKVLSGYDCPRLIRNGRKLTIELPHHDGVNKFELRRLTKKGVERLNNIYCEESNEDKAYLLCVLSVTQNACTTE